MQKDLDKIHSGGAALVAISYDSPEVLARFAETGKISYPLLSDSMSKTIDAYGVRNSAAGGRQEGIPHPTTFVIGRDQVVQGKLESTVYRRHSTDQLLDALQKL